MPAKRKHTEVAAANHSISAFTRVSKANLLPTNGKEVVTDSASNKKRKASSIEIENVEIHDRLAPRTVSFPPSSDDEAVTTPIRSKRTCRRQEDPVLSTTTTTTTTQSKPAAPKPVKGKRTAKTGPSRTETAHKPVDTTLISKSRTATKKTIQTKLDAASFKKTAKKTQGNHGLPAHLAELVDLHRAFIKTVMIQMVHEGSNVPIDVRTLGPNIARTWGKRQVTIEDIRRCIAVQGNAERGTDSPFIVSDYGRGKVCIELDSRHSETSVNEDSLCKQFEENLRHLCTERAADDMTDVDISLEGLSLGDIPQVAITNRDLGLKANPILAKGHRALTELKNDVVARQQEKDAKQQSAQNNPLLNADGTKMNLLDRLRYKQLARENGPLPPSGPELERRAALNRVADISSTISMLSLSKPPSLPRHAFTMPVILEKLKDSLRTPISKEEATNCLRLIADEVAPKWLRVVAIGGRENVVVQRNQQPVDRVIRERVEKLLG